MPVTITLVDLELTDDQAINLMSQLSLQVSSLLSKRPGTLYGDAVKINRVSGAKRAKRKSQGPKIKLVREFLDKIHDGHQFKHGEIISAIGSSRISSSNISYALGVLKKEGIITMSKRGTWKKHGG